MHGQVMMERGVFGMPKPRGWTVERITTLVAGLVVVATQALRTGRSRWPRLLAGWVGANLLLNAFAGWCPLGVMLHRAGVPTIAEATTMRRS